MPTMLVLAGDKFNVLEQCSSGVSMSGSDSLFPQAYLYDGRPGLVARFASPAAADQYVQVDADLLEGQGGFETWAGGSPAGFTEANTGTGDVTQEAVIVNGGASSAKLSAGSGTAVAYKDRDVRAGQKLRIQWALRGDGTGLTRLRVQNLATGKYLDNAGAWTASVVDVATQQATSWNVSGLNFQVESFAACLFKDPTLRITVLCNTASQVGYVDDVILVPAVDFVSIHGHNLDPGIVTTLRSSTDAFSGVDTVEATATKTWPTFFAYLAAPVYRRYWRLKHAGTNRSPIEHGELVLGQALALSRYYQDGPEYRQVEHDVATELPSGELDVTEMGTAPQRVLGLRFKFTSDAQMEENRDEIYRRSRGRVKPLVIVPDTARAEVLHGRIAPDWSVRRMLHAGYYDENDLTFKESPFVTTTA